MTQETSADSENQGAPVQSAEQQRTLGQALRALRVRLGLSLNGVAREAGIDPAHLHRIEMGAAGREVLPKREMLLSIGAALALDPASLEDLLVRAGYAPEALVALGGWDPTVAQVSRLLLDADLSQGSKSDFRDVISILANRWLSPSSE